MGLDIYAGPLCRYYQGNWQTMWQQQSTIPVTVIRPGASLWDRLKGLFGRDQYSAESIVRWRNELAAANHFQPATSWDWPENLEIGYQTDKPSSHGWEAVLQWAADHGDGYEHIRHPELWLPVEFDSVFEAETPTGYRCKIGSTQRLFREMRQLNAATWNANDTEIQSWNFLEAEEFEDTAKWGFAIWYALAKYADEKRLPMILDY